MAPRKRRKDRQHWPSNLYAAKKGRGLYYYYLRPDLPVDHPERYNGFGYVAEAEAIDAARQLNQVFGAGGDLAARVIGKAKGEPEQLLLTDYIKTFVEKTLPARRINGHPLSEHTLTEYKRLYRNIDAKLGKQPLRTITQGELADMLDELGTTAEVYNKYRTRLVDLYRHAVSDGKVPENLPEKIVPRDKEKKQRQRITLPGDKPGTAALDGIKAYRAIWKEADHAIRCAMELSLNCLQRRQEIFRWRRDWSRDDADGRHVYIRISKTHKHGIAAYIRVPESLPLVHSEFGAKTLGELIKHCYADGVASPHLVHRRPKRVKKAKGREHSFQLTAQQISKGFAAARDASGLYDHLPDEQKPTFHELIALGEHLRKKQGWSEGDLQRLRGHTKESTTKLYLEGHEWVTITPPTTSSGGGI